MVTEKNLFTVEKQKKFSEEVETYAEVIKINLFPKENNNKRIQ